MGLVGSVSPVGKPVGFPRLLQVQLGNNIGTGKFIYFMAFIIILNIYVTKQNVICTAKVNRFIVLRQYANRRFMGLW